MSQIEKIKIDSGSKTIEVYIDAVFSAGLEEIIKYAFTLKEVEECLSKLKADLQKEILLFFKNSKKFKWRETGEDVEINNDFINDVLGANCSVSTFKRRLKKASSSDLEKYKKILFEEDNFI
ncbi:MAG: hypothetical protein Q4G18_03275 [Myroides sp.]|nr:hypothetical protein [Myroides sp.]